MCRVPRLIPITIMSGKVLSFYGQMYNPLGAGVQETLGVDRNPSFITSVLDEVRMWINHTQIRDRVQYQWNKPRVYCASAEESVKKNIGYGAVQKKQASGLLPDVRLATW